MNIELDLLWNIGSSQEFLRCREAFILAARTVILQEWVAIALTNGFLHSLETEKSHVETTKVGIQVRRSLRLRKKRENKE